MLDYAQTLERTSFDRLLFYHYQLARAFEYRFLKPYRKDLNLQPLFSRFADLLGLHQPVLPAGGDVSAPSVVDNSVLPSNDDADFSELSGVYRSVLSDVALTFVDEANNEPNRGSVPRQIDLPQRLIDEINSVFRANHLNKLNNPAIITFNLFEEHEFGFPLAQADQRLISIYTLTSAAHYFGDRSDPCILQYIYSHNSRTYIRGADGVFLFRHGANDDSSPALGVGNRC